MKRTFLVFLLVFGLLLSLSYSVMATDVGEEQITVTESEAAVDGIKGQLYEAVWSFWSMWFPASVIDAFPDVFVLLSVGSTVCLLFLFLKLIGWAFGLIPRRRK